MQSRDQKGFGQDEDSVTLEPRTARPKGEKRVWSMARPNRGCVCASSNGAVGRGVRRLWLLDACDASLIGAALDGHDDTAEGSRRATLNLATQLQSEPSYTEREAQTATTLSCPVCSTTP